MNKQTFLNKLRSQLQENYSILLKSARSAHEYATHEEAKAESKYDTRGLEASYLAEAQSRRSTELQQEIALYSSMTPKIFKEGDPITIGAMVELECDNKFTTYFLGPAGGGLKIEMDDKIISVVTPKSPIGKKMMGKEIDDDFELVVKDQIREYLIVEIK